MYFFVFAMFFLTYIYSTEEGHPKSTSRNGCVMTIVHQFIRQNSWLPNLKCKQQISKNQIERCVCVRKAQLHFQFNYHAMKSNCCLQHYIWMGNVCGECWFCFFFSFETCQFHLNVSFIIRWKNIFTHICTLTEWKYILGLIDWFRWLGSKCTCNVSISFPLTSITINL